MRKWQQAALAGFMALALTACSSGGGGAAPTTTDSGETGETTVTAENIQPEEGASLVIWEDKNQRSFIEERAKKFEEEYGVSVKIEELPPTDQVTKLTTDGPAGLAADVVVFPHDKIGSASEAGLILPNDIFEQQTTQSTSDNAVKAVTFKDILYGYPYSVETYALFYNKKLYPEAPKSFDDIISFAKTFNDPKNNKYTLMWELQQFYYNFAYLASQGGYIFGDEGMNSEDIGLNNEGAIKGGQFLQTLKSEVLPVKMGDVNYDIKKGLFSSGKLAMDINGPWSIADYRNAGIDFGVAPLPAIEGKPMTSFSGVKAYYVNAFTTYPNAAKLFAAYLSSAESQMVNFEMNGTLPANKEVAADPKIQGDEITKAFLEQFNNSTPMPSLPAMDSVWGPISAAITDIWDGGKDVKTSLDNAVKQVKESLATTQ
ncbi:MULTISPECIES: sugar ABC transporter substrate-binding protein [Paenibacillus]|uniref:Maltodextrin-binding protein n=1 Tax=Paenibacillus pabuli TaxID=1472 RepID=A0A855YDT7_9BACL|nr:MULTISPECIES: maltose ABC transporter substrate-binding protein [Paenibacillus]PWW44877.1 carbohydrate ABC transporter substrate-binding protein (CUT1 family) [Paenibacillus pabuli]PXW11214.1 carbohydrate ABC transporter substrate-binding protein (CUT1 family) [Paenibacillus taichungensis]RAI93718.1 carbohydrate ABC transporter substrate-binding protein (CUT1 family) [Paenibacillus pabuli]